MQKLVIDPKPFQGEEEAVLFSRGQPVFSQGQQVFPLGNKFFLRGATSSGERFPSLQATSVKLLQASLCSPKLSFPATGAILSIYCPVIHLHFPDCIRKGKRIIVTLGRRKYIHTTPPCCCWLFSTSPPAPFLHLHPILQNEMLLLIQMRK